MHTVESAAIVLEASKCRDQERKEGGQNREGGFSARYSGQTGGLTGARVTLQRGDFARTYTIVRKFSEQLLVKAINSWKSTACVSTPNIDLQTRMHTKFWYRGWRYAIESVVPSNSLNAIPFVSDYASRPRIIHISRFFLSFLFQIYLHSAFGSLIPLFLRWNDFIKIYVLRLFRFVWSRISILSKIRQIRLDVSTLLHRALKRSPNRFPIVSHYLHWNQANVSLQKLRCDQTSWP